MKNKSKVLFVAITGACGFLAYKYGKSFCTSLKNSKNRQPLEEIAKEIKETMIKNVDDIRKNTEELKEKVEGICSEAVNSMYEEEDFFFEVEEKNGFVDTTYIKVPTKNIPVEDVEEQKKVEKSTEEKVESMVEENIKADEKSVIEENSVEIEKVEETEKSEEKLVETEKVEEKSVEIEKAENKGIENLKKRQAAKNPRKKTVKAEEKSDEVKVEITEEKSE